MAKVFKLALCVAVLTFAVLSSAAGRPVPANLKKLYNHAKAGTHRCRSPLSSTRFTDGHKRGGFIYCGDHEGILYLTGSSDRMALADMDVDCDGINRSKGACANDPSGQDQTAFKHEVSSYGIDDLDSNKHGYVVLGNQGSAPSYLPSASGVESLSVVAVVCNDILFYGVWGDTNGGTDVGEASMSLAHACFPDEHLSGDNGHETHDVLYVAFMGKQAKPGAKGANWRASSFNAFETSLAHIGDTLVSKIRV
ncbi:chitosanase [Nannizzia gypsea CBS 118893]|uniref:Endo-chitosanase n=1 Tax=Arthroderma gypseum (strain ATCC MYA-4604 / CBS 118893) TaxID=535722 RepID=E4UPA7_ARTGP|nr:chitosanase [Nannizzia gypsea CBS 118893]EFQ99833.1 chitosanase [Nannizzia gypsea CBS 118893]